MRNTRGAGAPCPNPSLGTPTLGTPTTTMEIDRLAQETWDETETPNREAKEREMKRRNTQEYSGQEEQKRPEISVEVSEILSSNLDKMMEEWRNQKREDDETRHSLREELRGDTPFAEFAKRGREGTLDRDIIDQVVHGGSAGFKPGEAEAPTQDQLVEYARKMQQEVKDFRSKLSILEWKGTQDIPDEEKTNIYDETHEAVNRNGMEHILEACPGHPTSELGHPNPPREQGLGKGVGELHGNPLSEGLDNGPDGRGNEEQGGRRLQGNRGPP